jgi:hypothetical protein
MILLRDFKGAMRLERSKGKSVNVSTRTRYDFISLTPVICKLWR